MKKFTWLMIRGALLSIGLLAFLASCTGTTDDEPSFTYSSGITAAFGMAQDAASSAPTWTNLPAGTVTYIIEAPLEGSILNVTPTVGSDGVVTVPQEAHAATEVWTVKAAVGGSTYTATITITVTAKNIADVQDFSISVGDKTATAKSTDSTHRAVIGGSLTATTDYTLKITDSSDNVPGFMSIDDNGGITINDSIAVSDRGTYTVTVAGAGNYSGTTSATFTLTVEPIDITKVTGFSITAGNQTVPPLQASDFPVIIDNAGLTAGTDYDLSIEKGEAPVNGVTIDNSGLVSIAATIDADNGGTYTVKATGKNNYFAVKTAEFVLTVAYSIGDPGPAGGRIFYVNPNAASDGWTYLEAAPSDLPGDIKWGNTTTEVGKTGTGIGTGESNTQEIVTKLGSNGGTDYAAKICSEYTVTNNNAVYSDWFMPSKDELNELYKQKNTVGGVANSVYWSSSEYSSTHAWVQSLGVGDQFESSKDSKFSRFVRAVRAF